MNWIAEVELLYNKYESKLNIGKDRIYCIANGLDEIEKMTKKFPKIIGNDIPIFGFCNSMNTNKMLGLLVSVEYMFTRPNRLFPAEKIKMKNIDFVYYDFTKDRVSIATVDQNGKEEDYCIATAGVKGATEEFKINLAKFLTELVKILKKVKFN